MNTSLINREGNIAGRAGIPGLSTFSLFPVTFAKTLHSQSLKLKMIDRMLFNAVFSLISVKSRWPVDLPMLSWNSFYQNSAQYYF